MVPQLSMRVKFAKGDQREFIKKVMVEIGAPSLRELSKRIDVAYSTMKNYHSEKRLLSRELFESLVSLSGIVFSANFVSETWGQVKGGKKGKRTRI